MEPNLKHNITFARLSEVEPTEIAAHMSDPRVAEHMPLLSTKWDARDCSNVHHNKRRLLGA